MVKTDLTICATCGKKGDSIYPYVVDCPECRALLNMRTLVKTVGRLNRDLGILKADVKVLKLKMAKL